MLLKTFGVTGNTFWAFMNATYSLPLDNTNMDGTNNTNNTGMCKGKDQAAAAAATGVRTPEVYSLHIPDEKELTAALEDVLTPAARAACCATMHRATPREGGARIARW
jgi:hypothetical protein